MVMTVGDRASGVSCFVRFVSRGHRRHRGAAKSKRSVLWRIKKLLINKLKLRMKSAIISRIDNRRQIYR